ncbi:MAG: hypothetical protein ACLGI3_02150 [Actinomycetes bacterium]
MAAVEVFVCCGSDCRRRRDAHALLLAAAAQAGTVRPVRCQKICSGPVAGVEVAGRLEWFERLRGPKSRGALVRLLATGGPLPKRLRKRRVRKRSGRLRGRPSG